MTEQPGAMDPKQYRASDADREHVAQLLQSAMTEGRITMAELDQRLSQVYAAKTLGELDPVVVDLPGAIAPPSTGNTPALRQPRTPENRVGGVPGSTTSIAVMSGAERKGKWVVPAQHNSFAFWGGVELDLRRARFAEQETTITAVAIMAGIDITVPDDVRLEVSGVGFMGAFERTDKSSAADEDTVPADAPVVRINGLAFWAGVEVHRVPRNQGKNRADKQLE